MGGGSQKLLVGAQFGVKASARGTNYLRGYGGMFPRIIFEFSGLGNDISSVLGSFERGFKRNTKSCSYINFGG